jgi:hypothetical protein
MLIENLDTCSHAGLTSCGELLRHHEQYAIPYY